MNWCFGTNAGLSFTSVPPTSFTNSAMNTLEGCATISSPTGALLFYTDGITIWNRAHTVMANGNGLTGNQSSSQSGVIIKQPGNSNIYYVFSVPVAGVGSLAYSIVDLSLAAGLGSVTTKNATLFSPTAEKLTAAKHCNGVDIWILGHEQGSNLFHAYLLSSGGLSPAPITSAVGSSYSGFNYAGYLKMSPSGKKMAAAVYSSCLELFDFDNTTGTVSNPLVLNNYPTNYGCEFSPDGSKLYVGTWFTASPGLVYQYDLCAGSPAAVLSSETIIASSAPYKGALQLAPNGKIYVTRFGQSDLGVINDPNLPGTACNYVDQGQSIWPKTCVYGLPNFLPSNPPPTPFTYTISSTLGCQTASFNSTYNPTVTTLACSSIGYSVTGLLWNFGDPASGSSNASTLQNPVHAFSTLGTFNVNLILYYSCGGGTDTIKQLVNINCITVTNTSITCASLGSATAQANSGSGPFSYTWMPTAQTSSVATGLSPGNYTITVFDSGTNVTYTALAIFTSPIPLTGSVNITDKVHCNGASTGTGNISNVTGGTGNYNYVWTNGSLSYTNASTSSLSAGSWSVQITDAVSGCHFEHTSVVDEPPVMTIALSSNTASACAGKSVTLSGACSGGTPFSPPHANYTYTWSVGENSNSVIVGEAQAGSYVYTLYAGDSLKCLVSNTISVDFIPNPSFIIKSSKTIGCVPFTSKFTLSNSTTNPFKYVWKLDGKTLDASSYTYQFTKPGNYAFTWQATDTISSCVNTKTLVVNAYARPVAGFDYEPKKPIEGRETVIFTNTSITKTFVDYHWHFIDNSGFSSRDQNTSYYFSNAGKYPVALVISDTNGCADSIVRTIEVVSEYAFFIPNAFTPNDDDRNDVFMPAISGVKFYELMIFNRWGDRIFQTDDPNIGWNGAYKEEACKQDFYIWKIKLTTIDGDEKNYSGSVILLR